MNELLKYSHFTFDSRTVKTGSIFFALSTGARNGIEFAENAINNGASFLVLESEPNFEISKEKYIVVKNSLDFAARLARQKFLLLKERGVKTVSITGSAGKTTTKDLTHFLLTKEGKKVFSTEGNLNNYIGVPFTILNTPFDIEFLVLEMGMNNAGEISHLVNIADTDVRVITNIGEAHIGNFKDGINGIFSAKTEILENSTKETIFITPESLLFLEKINFIGKTIKVGYPSCYKTENGKTFFTAFKKELSFEGIITKEVLLLRVIAAQILKAFNVEPDLDFTDFKLAGGRGNKIILPSGEVLIDESYNANPQSMKNAILTLSMHQGSKKLIIGSMKELGEHSKNLHYDVFTFATSFPDIKVFFVGEEFNFGQENWFLSVDDLISQLSNLPKSDVTLIKASHSMNFFKIRDFFLISA